MRDLTYYTPPQYNHFVGKKKKSLEHESIHQNHQAELPRIRRVIGQVGAIERMITEERYCMDILQQIKAARSALLALETNVLRSHLEGCVKQALMAPDSFEAEKKIKEISKLLGR